MATTFGNSFSEINWNAVGKFHNISPRVRSHLDNVYATLTGTILSAAVGAAFFLEFHIGGSWSFLVGLGLLIWLAATPSHDVSKRLGILASFGFVQGLSLGPLLEHLIEVDPQIVITALAGTVAVFACFSASALYAQRRTYLYLGGLLGSGLSLLVTLSFLNIFFRSSLAVSFSIYFGLILFCGFIIFDTQLIVEKADVGHTDFVADALNLFLDFVNVFVRLLAILSKKSNKRRN